MFKDVEAVRVLGCLYGMRCAPPMGAILILLAGLPATRVENLVQNQKFTERFKGQPYHRKLSIAREAVRELKEFDAVRDELAPYRGLRQSAMLVTSIGR